MYGVSSYETNLKVSSLEEALIVNICFKNFEAY